jgi:riboflavin synthase alpha subunit
MFTGIVEGVGKVKKISKATKNRSARFRKIW